MPQLSRTTVVAAVAALALTALAGCSGSGSTATTATTSPTNQPNQGANGDVGRIGLRDMVLVRGPEGSQSATMVGTIVGSSSDDQLTSITVAPPPKSTYITNGEVTVPRDTTVPIGHSGEQHINVYGFDPGSTSAIVSVTFIFRDAGEATLMVKVVPARDEYAGVVPVPSVAPSP